MSGYTFSHPQSNLGEAIALSCIQDVVSDAVELLLEKLGEIGISIEGVERTDEKVSGYTFNKKFRTRFGELSLYMSLKMKGNRSLKRTKGDKKNYNVASSDSGLRRKYEEVTYQWALALVLTSMQLWFLVLTSASTVMHSSVKKDVATQKCTMAQVCQNSKPIAANSHAVIKNIKPSNQRDLKLTARNTFYKDGYAKIPILTTPSQPETQTPQRDIPASLRPGPGSQAQKQTYDHMRGVETYDPQA